MGVAGATTALSARRLNDRYRYEVADTLRAMAAAHNRTAMVSTRVRFTRSASRPKGRVGDGSNARRDGQEQAHLRGADPQALFQLHGHSTHRPHIGAIQRIDSRQPRPGGRWPALPSAQ